MSKLSRRTIKRLTPPAAAPAAAPSSGWTRPAAWLALPDVTTGQRFAGLLRIDRDANFVALTASGAYTVDWGDGTVEDFNSGAQAQRQYNWADIPNTGEAELGHRQVIIQVYPQAGADITTFSLQRRHGVTGLSGSRSTPWLDVAINFPLVTSLTVGGTTTGIRALQRAVIHSHAATSLASLFINCSALREFSIDTTGVTNLSAMFSGCSSLAYCQTLNTASATNLSSMFSGCSALAEAPALNTSAATNASSMFQNCSALEAAPNYDLSAVTNATSLFFSCRRLVEIPPLNLPANASATSLVRDCTSLRAIPSFVSPSVTSWGTMATSSTSLVEIPDIDVSAVTSFASAFSSCTSLAKVRMTGINATISFSGCALSPEALNEIFTNLSSSGSGKTITITSNWGTSACDTSIATAKGWTVTT